MARKRQIRLRRLAGGKAWNSNASELGDKALRTDFTACIKDVKKDVSEIGERVNDLEHTKDARSEDHEKWWRCIQTLEEQHLELQAKQEDLENCSRPNNICIRGTPRGQEDEDILAHTAALLHALIGDADALLPMLDRAPQVASA
ncbi:hypothetical protein NDU88_004592 [Pleurodeles waltl]|uniref:Uncharacterized protein n=1 Tax=Pleurodeles waltl TaxID=8319 RepID=A0AAV7LRF2_PLEWA|nr:hypothetical protein NDU88_004592 [Pleurodeles waltl]